MHRLGLSTVQKEAPEDLACTWCWNLAGGRGGSLTGQLDAEEVPTSAFLKLAYQCLLINDPFKLFLKASSALDESLRRQPLKPQQGRYRNMQHQHQQGVPCQYRICFPQILLNLRAADLEVS